LLLSRRCSSAMSAHRSSQGGRGPAAAREGTWAMVWMEAMEGETEDSEALRLWESHGLLIVLHLAARRQTPIQGWGT
jgi:hypothetical protein